MTNVAIIGCGEIYQNHARAIAQTEGLTLYAVCDIIPEIANKAAALYHCKAYTNYLDLIADPMVDTVHICTPHYLHSEIAIASMYAGKDVLSEKPICIHPSDANRIYEVSKETGRKFGVCFQNRYNKTSQKAKELLESGELGTIKGAKAIFTWQRDEPYYNQAAWRGTWNQEGGGVLINQSIHTLDLLQWLLGDVKSIFANVATRKLSDTIEVEDTADAFIVFESGAECIFFASNCYVSTSRVEVEIVSDLGLLQIFGDELFWTPNGGAKENLLQAESATGPKACWGVGHVSLIQDFYDRRKKNEAFLIDAKEGAKALNMIDAIYRSSSVGRAIML